MNAPIIWAAMYTGTAPQLGNSALNLCARAIARVTAGLRCAPLEAAIHTPTKTAMPQPQLMTIQPALLPLVRLSTTLATTPLPRMTRMAVPISSARKGDMVGLLLEEYDAGKGTEAQRHGGTKWGPGKEGASAPALIHSNAASCSTPCLRASMPSCLHACSSQS